MGNLVIDDASQALLTTFAYATGRYEGVLESVRAVLVSYSGELPGNLMQGLASAIESELATVRQRIAQGLQKYNEYANK